MKIRTQETRREYEEKMKISNKEIKLAKEEMWKRLGRDLEIDFENTRKLLFSLAKKYRRR